MRNRYLLGIPLF